MGFWDFILLLIVAGFAGAMGQAISGFSRGGCLVSIAIGFIGAMLGTWMARQLELPQFLVLEFGTTGFPLLWAIFGAALFTGLLGFLSRSRTPRKE